MDTLHGARAFIYPTTEAELAAAGSALRDQIDSGRYLVVDCETSGWDMEDPRFIIRTIQLGTSEAVVVLDPADQGQAALARTVLAEAPLLSAHNADYDLVPLARFGYLDDLREAYGRTWDTYMAAMLVRPPMEKARVYGLKDLAESLAGGRACSARALTELQKEVKLREWGSLNPKGYVESAWAKLDIANPAFVAYAAADVVDGSLVAEALLPLAQLTVPAEVLARERSLATEAALMRLRGLRLDREFTQARLDEAAGVVADAEVELDAVLRDLDFDTTGHTAYSDALLAAAAIEAEGMDRRRTGKGGVATDRAVLEEWEAAGSLLAGPWLRRRKAEKLVSTYYARYLRAGSDRIHPTLIPLQASTGRMASKDPNFQNLPARDESVQVRECFVADEGNVFISADFSSVEMRVAAAVTGDAKLVEIYTTDPTGVADARALDPYWLLAWELYGPEASKGQRQAVKSIVLGRMYGGGVETLAAGVGLTTSKAREVLDQYDRTYEGLAPWAGAHIRPWCEMGRSWWHLPSGRYQSINPGSSWKALNSIIQGYSRDVLADALLRVAGDPDLGPGIAMPIHDELLVQVPADRAEELMARLEQLMSTDVGIIPVPAEGSIHGRRWTAK